MKIKPQEATSIINALNGGVVPSLGIQHITVGRDQEIKAIIRSLTDTANGHSQFRFWIGDFGTGKSFILQLIKNIALKKDFVVVSADFTPELRLYANDRKAVNLYSKLMRNLSTQTSPQGNALPGILSSWIEDCLTQISQKHQLSREVVLSPQSLPLIQDVLVEKCRQITQVGGYEFGKVISKYLEGFVTGDEQLQQSALKWFYGEYTTLTEARQDLTVRTIIDDRNYYDMLKNLASLFRSLGYTGLVINLDEAVNLYKISQTPSRNKNYEKLLTIYNDCLQTDQLGLFFNIAGTEKFLTDQRRGLFSYNALKTRLSGNSFETEQLQDYNQPVILLKPLDQDQILYLLGFIKQVFEVKHSQKIDFSQKDIINFMENLLNREGATSLLTPRDTTRQFLQILNLIQQNPDQKSTILSGLNQNPTIEPSDIEIL